MRLEGLMLSFIKENGPGPEGSSLTLDSRR